VRQGKRALEGEEVRGEPSFLDGQVIFDGSEERWISDGKDISEYVLLEA
jgi:hypothetical protein